MEPISLPSEIFPVIMNQCTDETAVRMGLTCRALWQQLNTGPNSFCRNRLSELFINVPQGIEPLTVLRLHCRNYTQFFLEQMGQKTEGKNPFAQKVELDRQLQKSPVTDDQVATVLEDIEKHIPRLAFGGEKADQERLTRNMDALTHFLESGKQLPANTLGLLVNYVGVSLRLYQLLDLDKKQTITVPQLKSVLSDSILPEEAIRILLAHLGPEEKIDSDTLHTILYPSQFSEALLLKIVERADVDMSAIRSCCATPLSEPLVEALFAKLVVSPERINMLSPILRELFRQGKSLEFLIKQIKRFEVQPRLLEMAIQEKRSHAELSILLRLEPKPLPHSCLSEALYKRLPTNMIETILKYTEPQSLSIDLFLLATKCGEASTIDKILEQVDPNTITYEILCTLFPSQMSEETFLRLVHLVIGREDSRISYRYKGWLNGVLGVILANNRSDWLVEQLLDQFDFKVYPNNIVEAHAKKRSQHLIDRMEARRQPDILCSLL